MRLKHIGVHSLAKLVVLGQYLFMMSHLSASPLISFGDAATVHALFSGQSRYSSNIYNNHEDIADDLIFTASPGLEINLGQGSRSIGQKSKYEGSLRVVEDVDVYTDNDELSTGLTRINFNLNYDPGSRFALANSGSFDELAQNTGTENVQGQLIRRHEYKYTTRADYLLSEKTKLDTNFSVLSVNYRNFEDSFNSRQDYSIPFNAYYVYSPKLDLGVGYEYRYSDLHQTDPMTRFVHDRSDQFINLRARGEFSPTLSGLLYTGVRFQRIHGISTDQLLAIGADVKFDATQKLSFNVGFTRDTESNGLGNLISKTGGSVGAKYIATDKITTGVSTSFYVEQTDATDTEQESFSFNWYAEYAYSQYLSYLLGYYYFNNDATFETGNFHSHVVNVRASLKY